MSWYASRIHVAFQIIAITQWNSSKTKQNLAFKIMPTLHSTGIWAKLNEILLVFSEQRLQWQNNYCHRPPLVDHTWRWRHHSPQGRWCCWTRKPRRTPRARRTRCLRLHVEDPVSTEIRQPVNQEQSQPYLVTSHMFCQTFGGRQPLT